VEERVGETRDERERGTTYDANDDEGGTWRRRR
jgi:hypothetical protein